MSEEKKETKEALLGELESIKALLSEEEWDDIPILNDAIALDNDASARDNDASALEVELEPTLAPSDDPETVELLEPDAAPDAAINTTQPQGLSATEEEDIQHPVHNHRSDIDAAVDKFHFDLELENGDEDDVDDRAECHTQSNANLAAVDASELPPGVLPGQQSLFETAEPDSSSTDAIDATPLPSDDNELSQLSAESADITADSDDLTTVPDTSTQPDASTQPAALTAQPAEITAQPAETTEQPVPLEKNPVGAQTRRPAFKTRGENPFLPQHIRDRLHTHKALIDIIKETPVSLTPPSRIPAFNRQLQSAEKLTPSTPEAEAIQKVVDGLIASYLPKMEAELREKLTLMVEQQLADKPGKD